MDILQKFLELTNTIHSFGSEYLMRRLLPEYCEQDRAGNYFLKLGRSESMFAAHLDTVASHDIEEVNHIVRKGLRRTIVKSRGNTILGADDRSGVLVLLYMIEKQIPGLYYFFIGEEKGLIGSRKIASTNPEFFLDYQRCISFDRIGYGSIISRQIGEECCSSLFADSLAAELSPHSSKEFFNDEFGGRTDSYSFTHLIPECTNISVGYFDAHKTSEYQDITYLEELCKATCKVKWEKLPTNRQRNAA